VCEYGFGDVREHVRLWEFLRAEYERGSRSRMKQENRKAGKNQEKIWEPGNKQERNSWIPIPGFLISRLTFLFRSCFADSIHRLTSPRCALMNSETKGSAGLSRRSVTAPFCMTRPSFMSTISSPK